MNKVHDKDNSELLVNDWNGSLADQFSDIALLQLRDFISALHGADTSYCTGEEGAAVVKFIEQCYALKHNRSRPKLTPTPGIMW